MLTSVIREETWFAGESKKRVLGKSLLVGCSRRWGIELKENAWLDMHLGWVIGPENAWNLGGREGVRKRWSGSQLGAAHRAQT